MSSLNVIPTGPSGQPISNVIITVGLMDGAGQPAPMEPAIRTQSNFWSAQFPYGTPLHPAPFVVYGTVRASGYKEAYFSVTWDGASDLTIPVTLSPGFKLPTRAEACSIRRHFQGLTIDSQQYGSLPWFVPTLISFEEELDHVLDQLLAAGDTHCTIAPFWSYGEPGQPWGNQVPALDLWTNPADRPRYLAVVDRVIARGLIPVFDLLGEGSPDWIQHNLQDLVTLLRSGGVDRTLNGPFYVVYDGVWPATWSVAQMKTTIPWIRAILGDSAYVGFMFATNGGRPYFYVENEGDYGQPWMQALDFVMMSTGPDQAQCPALVNGFQYFLGPNLKPSGVCTPDWGSPWIMSPGTPRGPYFGGFDEWYEYQWVRGQVSQATIDADRARMESVGILSHG